VGTRQIFSGRGHIPRSCELKQEFLAMTAENAPPMFPKVIHSPQLGALSFNEFELCDGITHRSYESVDSLHIPITRLQLSRDGLRLVVWPPDTGVPDVTQFTLTIENRFNELFNRLNSILDESISHIDAAIDNFWAIPDERAPTSSALLDAAELRQINLNAGDGSHVMILYDRGDLIGSHDILLELSPDFHPISANFDG
jgi:hypothetical protein